MASFIKDPDSTLDYTINWRLWLDGDSVSNSVWEVPADLTLEANSYTDEKTTVWLSGGNPGKSYNVINRINTEAGRIEDRTIIIRIRDR